MAFCSQAKAEALAKARWEAQQATALAQKKFDALATLEGKKKAKKTKKSSLGEDATTELLDAKAAVKKAKKPKESEECAYDRQMGEMNYNAAKKALARMAAHAKKEAELAAANQASAKAKKAAEKALAVATESAKTAGQKEGLARQLMAAPCGTTTFEAEWKRNLAAWKAAEA